MSFHNWKVLLLAGKKLPCVKVILFLLTAATVWLKNQGPRFITWNRNLNLYPTFSFSELVFFRNHIFTEQIIAFLVGESSVIFLIQSLGSAHQRLVGL
jgi:hypothetical protein